MLEYNEYNELETIASEIAYLRYHARCEAGRFNYVHESMGLERALEICGYTVGTNVYKNYFDNVVVEVRIFNSEFDKVFTFCFMEGEF